MVDALKLLFVCILLGLAGGIWFSYLRPVSLGGPVSYAAVHDGGTVPALDDGDLVFIQAQANYHIGDVIAIRHDGGRAIQRVDALSGLTYFARGEDGPLRPTNAEIEGKVVMHLPGAGWLVEGSSLPIFLTLVAGLVTAVVVLCRSAVSGAITRRPRDTDEVVKLPL